MTNIDIEVVSNGYYVQVYVGGEHSLTSDKYVFPDAAGLFTFLAEVLEVGGTAEDEDEKEDEEWLYQT